MDMKRRTLALSILTVVCCLGLIVGATLALFNSSSKVDISVTSGDVNVSATITNYTTYSKGAETAEKGTFENGGTATVDGGSVVLDRISPMDKIVLESKFTTVLLSKCVDGRYLFETQARNSTAKSPMGAFDTFEIENDIVEVIKALEEF